MTTVDFRGCAITGATPAALDAYERALAAFQAWRVGVDEPLERALLEASGFVMAHVLQAYQVLSSRDPRHVRSARQMLDRAAGLPANTRERLHLATIRAVLDDDYLRAKTLLGDVLRSDPLDIAALQVVHGFDYITGDLARMKDRVASVLPAWSNDLPGYHAVLAMHAFSLEENGEYDRAEDTARAALALNPADARAHHVMAHVFEMTERADAGVRWMEEHRDHWGVGTVVATHCWWHMALFHLAQGRLDDALALFDEHLRARHAHGLANLIDASALLWRLDLRGCETGARWAELAAAWAPHIDDGYCTFSDLHAMLAFIGARDDARVHCLERSLTEANAVRSRYGETTRQLGLPAGRALIAFGRGDDTRAIRLLADLPPLVHRIGGSNAQRDVLHLTLLHAIERIRWPARRMRRAGATVGPKPARVTATCPA